VQPVEPPYIKKDRTLSARMGIREITT